MASALRVDDHSPRWRDLDTPCPRGPGAGPAHVVAVARGPSSESVEPKGGPQELGALSPESGGLDPPAPGPRIRSATRTDRSLRLSLRGVRASPRRTPQGICPWVELGPGAHGRRGVLEPTAGTTRGPGFRIDTVKVALSNVGPWSGALKIAWYDTGLRRSRHQRKAICSASMALTHPRAPPARDPYTGPHRAHPAPQTRTYADFRSAPADRISQTADPRPEHFDLDLQLILASSFSFKSSAHHRPERVPIRRTPELYSSEVPFCACTQRVPVLLYVQNHHQKTSSPYPPTRTTRRTPPRPGGATGDRLSAQGMDPSLAHHLRPPQAQNPRLQAA